MKEAWRTPLMVGFVALVVALGALQCRAWNGAPNADGISYLELAARYAQGDLRTVTNGYWSPLYPALLGIALRVAGAPSIHLGNELAPELRVALAINLLVLAVATLCFARLVLALDAAEPEPPPMAVRTCRFLAAGALWIWCAIRLVGATTITPDMLLAAWLMLATTELVALTRGAPTRAGLQRFAVALGAGYWTKAVFLPLVIVAIAGAIVLVRRVNRRSALPWLVLLPLGLCAPLVVIESVAQGHLSFGETGRLNYEWYVNDVPRLAPGAPTSPSVVRMATGQVLLTGSEPGSFPYWYDPSRFAVRGPTAFSMEAQERTLRVNVEWLRVVAGTFAALCLVAAFAAVARQRAQLQRFIVIAPALALLVLHLLTHPEGRLAGAAIAIVLTISFYLGGTAHDRDARRPIPLRVVECSALVAIAVLAVGHTSNRLSLAPRILTLSVAGDAARHGLHAGDHIGILGSGFGQYWVHEAGAQIVLANDGRLRETKIPDAAALLAVSREACEHGEPVAALVWQQDPASPLDDGEAKLPAGWRMWTPPAPCAGARIVAR